MGSFYITLALMLVLSQMISFYMPSFGELRSLVWLLFFPISLHLLNRYSSHRKRGVVTPTGLKRYNQDTEITFDTIKSIAGGQGLQNIFTANTSVKIYLPKQEIVKLFKTSLNNWTINNYSINILPSLPSESLIITYAPFGKYTFNLLPMLYILIFISIFVPSAYRIIMFVLGIGLYCFLKKYPKFTVRICDGGVSIIKKSKEIFISFSDIQSVEKNIFYIKIHTTDKKTFLLPKRCLYLYNLLKFFCGNNT